MGYKAKGMHAAATGYESAVRDKGKTVRTILRRGRPQRVLFGFEFIIVHGWLISS